ncbi:MULTISPECIES: helix-turn-helix domain-containing protein [Halorussus]|uniref:helix-turn-helix domain-containing protein n=1 Tax=Halorussus TaxID=1070314 RepID=UPI0020A1B5BA|nr:helix-turn-helix domain-containing protein [Halorussus vallis]USZ75088.1 helix-turn-helix domain-containing protein [Halorussus vallis]
MSVVAEFTISADEFLLGRVLAQGPDTVVELERVVPASRQVMPYIWVRGNRFEEFEAAVRSSPYVTELTALDRLDDSALYRVAWDENVESLIHGIAETDATILEAYGDDEWKFRIRFDDHSGLAAFHNYCTDHDISFHLDRVYTLADEQEGGYVFDLTDPQRVALTRAVEEGYFEVPRGVTLGDLADELGVSEQAISERVRRGADKVLKKVLLTRSARDLGRE